MPTLQMYRYAFKPSNLDEGIQTLRGSPDLVATSPVQVGRARQLLMDHHVVDDLNGAERIVHQPSKHEANPILSACEPWEAGGACSYGTIMRDQQTGLFRLWAPLDDMRRQRPEGKSLQDHRGLYYESDDGLTWRRPKLGRFAFDGSKANNIFHSHGKHLVGTLCVLALPPRMADRGRFAMLYAASLRDREPNRAAVCVAFSDDGLEWTDAPANPVLCGRAGAAISVVYNPQRDLFMMYRRASVNAGEVRRIAYCQSTDLLDWSQPVNVFGHDECDPIHLYGMQVAHYREVYFGLLHCLHMHPDGKRHPLTGGKDFLLDTQLAWSRDGLHWFRHPKRPTFLPTSPPYQGACDWGFATAMTELIEVDDTIRVYYGGREYLHKPGARSRDNPLLNHFCLATLQRDRFVSISAGPDGGYMLTRPMAYLGGKLHINARTNAQGFIRVAIREAQGTRDGEWPETWRFDDCTPFAGDSLDHVVTWHDHGPQLEEFPADVLRLHFWLENADLFSFWFE